MLTAPAENVVPATVDICNCVSADANATLPPPIDAAVDPTLPSVDANTQILFVGSTSNKVAIPLFAAAEAFAACNKKAVVNVDALVFCV